MILTRLVFQLCDGTKVKYYEWHNHDLAAALSWTQEALDLTSPFNRDLRDELNHRRNRLERKINREF